MLYYRRNCRLNWRGLGIGSAAASSLLLGGLLLTGCASVGGSVDANSPRARAASGPTYKLPMKTMTATVGSSAAGLFVAIYDARYEGDDSAAYVLRYNPDSASADMFDIMVDSKTGLLTSAKADADSKAADAVNNLAESAGRVFSVMESEGQTSLHLYQKAQFKYWPRSNMSVAEAKDGLTDFNQRLNDMLRKTVEIEGCGDKDSPFMTTSSRTLYCTADGSLKPGVATPVVQLEIDYTPYHGGAGGGDCEVGICTRNESLAEFSLTGGRTTDVWETRLPNGSAPVPIPLRRVAFTKATTEVKLENGLPTNFTFQKGAELPAITALPGSVIGAFVGGVVKGATDVTNFHKAKTDIATAKATPTVNTPQKPPAAQNESQLVPQTESDFDKGVVLFTVILQSSSQPPHEPLPQEGGKVVIQPDLGKQKPPKNGSGANPSPKG